MEQHWLDRFADALHVPPLSPEDVETLLDLARLVAHGTERRNAPLATYLVGRWAAERDRDPAGAMALVQELLEPDS